MSNRPTPARPDCRSDRRALRAACAIEALEPRRLLSAVSGTVFDDLNGNQVQDPGEAPIEGRVVWVDNYDPATRTFTTPNGRLDPGERTTTTDEKGEYRLSGLPGVPSGTDGFVVRQQVPEGSNQTYPNRFGTRSSDFNIEIDYTDGSEDALGESGRRIVESAVERWRQVIVGDVADAQLATYTGDANDPILDEINLFDDFRENQIPDPRIFVNPFNPPPPPGPANIDVVTQASDDPFTAFVSDNFKSLDPANPKTAQERRIVRFLRDNFTFEAFDDTRLTVTASELDPSLLGQARPIVLRDGDFGTVGDDDSIAYNPDDPGDGEAFVPFTGELELNTLYAGDADLLYETAVHEIGHALGFGTTWTLRGVTPAPGPNTSPLLVYNGPAGVAAYNEVFANVLPRPVDGVPFENSGGVGSVRSHWRESVFENELETPIAEGGSTTDIPTGQIDDTGRSPLSRVTAASLIDLGYDVDVNAAAFYRPPGDRSIAPGFYDRRAEMPSFSHVVDVAGGEQTRNQNFGVRQNAAPAIVALRAPATASLPGTNAGGENDGENDGEGDGGDSGDGTSLITLQALGVRDVDDRTYAVNFYRESNGRAGLQTGAGGDAYISQDESIAGGWRVQTDVSGLAPGVYTYYARAFDELLAVSTVRANVTVIGAQDAPAAPTDLRVTPISTSVVRLNFVNPTPEPAGGDVLDAGALASRVEASTSPDFSTIDRTLTSRISGDADGPQQVDVGGLRGGTLYYFRVVPTNTAGDGAASDTAVVATLAPGEVILDASAAAVEVLPDGSITKTRGDFELADDRDAFGLDVLYDRFPLGQGTQVGIGPIGPVPADGVSPSDVIFQPNLSPGRYFVYARWTTVGSEQSATAVPIDVFAGDGSRRPTTVTVDESERGGGFVALGDFEFAGGTSGFVRIRNYALDTLAVVPGIVSVDAVRFQPADSLSVDTPTLRPASFAASRPPASPFADGAAIAGDDEATSLAADLLA